MSRKCSDCEHTEEMCTIYAVCEACTNEVCECCMINGREVCYVCESCGLNVCEGCVHIHHTKFLVYDDEERMMRCEGCV